MPSDESARLLNEISQILSADTKYPLEGTFLYAIVDWNMVAASVFKDIGDRLIFLTYGNRLTYPLLNLWEAEPPERRWSVIEYRILGEKFEATFTYPEEMDPEEDSIDSRERALRRHFGDKPVIYPSILDDEDDYE